MSKVVTIPKDRNPFVVIVNGVRYSYPAGATTEVPDAVADVIEKYEGAKPKPDPNAGISFGGAQSDWNQTDSSAADFIKNKPFGDMPTGGDTLYWDGNTEGLDSVSEMIYKVSDTVLAAEDVAKDGITLSATFWDPESSNVVETVVSAPDSVSETDGVIQIACGSYCVMSVNAENAAEAGVGAGIYFMKYNNMYISSLTIPGYTGFPVTKKMEEKYLPGAVILYSDGTYLYNTEDVTDAAKRTTKAEFEKLLFSIQKICVGVDDGGMIYFTPDMYYEEENYMVASSSAAQLGFYTAEYVPAS